MEGRKRIWFAAPVALQIGADKKDLQDGWKMAMTHPGKYVNLLVGQLDNKDPRVERDKENHYDSEPWDRVAKNFFLAYHQVKAQAR